MVRQCSHVHSPRSFSWDLLSSISLVMDITTNNRIYGSIKPTNRSRSSSTTLQSNRFHNSTRPHTPRQIHISLSFTISDCKRRGTPQEIDMQ